MYKNRECALSIFFCDTPISKLYPHFIKHFKIAKKKRLKLLYFSMYSNISYWCVRIGFGLVLSITQWGVNEFVLYSWNYNSFHAHLITYASKTSRRGWSSSPNDSFKPRKRLITRLAICIVRPGAITPWFY